ncbi:hypothetical protein BURK2_00524 [Burkholderiales bacterium]|nr:hypothetical protein BURK2_00524 [Burkholderiales bacterium]
MSFGAIVFLGLGRDVFARERLAFDALYRRALRADAGRASGFEARFVRLVSVW